MPWQDRNKKNWLKEQVLFRPKWLIYLSTMNQANNREKRRKKKRGTIFYACLSIMNPRKKSAAVACLGTVSFRRYIRRACRQTRHFIIWQSNVSFGGNYLFKNRLRNNSVRRDDRSIFSLFSEKRGGKPREVDFFFVNAKPVYSTIGPSLHRPVEKGTGRCKFRLPGIHSKEKEQQLFSFAILFSFSKYPLEDKNLFCGKRFFFWERLAHPISPVY